MRLLIADDHWLGSTKFRRFVDLGVVDEMPSATVRWAEAIVPLDEGWLVGPDTAKHALRLAASLSGGVPVDLRASLSADLGSVHSDRVVAAVSHVLY